jgi:hypothetical protein
MTTALLDSLAGARPAVNQRPEGIAPTIPPEPADCPAGPDSWKKNVQEFFKKRKRLA